MLCHEKRADLFRRQIINSKNQSCEFSNVSFLAFCPKPLRVQALRWCDEGAYLLASQMVDKFQTREGAQEALQYLSCHQERAPSALKTSQDTLSLEFEAILSPQLQVSRYSHKHTDDPQPTLCHAFFFF